MVALDRLIVITSKDLASVDESLVFVRQKAGPPAFLIEDDCACSSPSGKKDDLEVYPTKCTESLFEITPYVAPALYMDKLNKDFYFAFNPSGQAGVVAINQLSLEFLKLFQQPRSLVQGLHHLGLPISDLNTVQPLVTLGMLEAVGQQKESKQTQAQTLTAWLHVTNDCNLRCPYCYVQKTPDPMEVEIGQQSIEAVFRSAIAQGYRQVKLKYAGGEATLNFHLVLLLHQYAQRLAAEFDLALDGVVLSNGVALTS